MEIAQKTSQAVNAVYNKIGGVKLIMKTVRLVKRIIEVFFTATKVAHKCENCCYSNVQINSRTDLRMTAAKEQNENAANTKRLMTRKCVMFARCGQELLRHLGVSWPWQLHLDFLRGRYSLKLGEVSVHM